MEKKKFYTHDELMDNVFGEIGTPKRDKYEQDFDLFLVGDAIKQLRISKSLSQEELGKLIGVQKAQISKIENGKNLTMATLQKVFKALNVNVKLQIEDRDIRLAVS